MNGFPPIPASPFFLDHLLGLLFLVHIVFMNYTLAAPFVASGYLIASGSKAIPKARLMAAVHPVAYTFAINSGVAVLLFVQVIFGRNFFTATSILGALWLTQIVLLILSFYGSYLFKSYLNRETANPKYAAMIGFGSGILLIAVAVLMITNYFVGHSEALWEKLLATPTLVHASPMFLPRFFHFLVGSATVCGFWMLWIGKFRLKSNPELKAAEQLKIDGLRLAAGATGVQVIVGIWYLLKVPTNVWSELLGGSFLSTIWISGIVSGLLMLAVLGLSILHHGRAIWHKLSTALLLWTIFGMIAGREIVRLSALGPDFDLKKIPYEGQSGAMLLFWLVLLIGLGSIVYLLKLVWPSRRDH